MALLRHIFLFFIFAIFTGWSWGTEATTAGSYYYDASIEYNFAGKSTDSPTHYERSYSYEGILHPRHCCGQQLTEYQDGEVRVGVFFALLGDFNVTKGPKAINGAKVDNLTPGEIKRIQNATDRIQTDISVVGGRAAVKGGRSPNADFDFVIDANHRTRSKISNSLPGAGNLKEGVKKNQDIFRKIDDSSQPQIIFTPRGQ